MSHIIDAVTKLKKYHESGVLQGEVMPEDANPGFKDDIESALRYFTLPMALNYQRNSYSLWKAALATYNDADTSFVYDPNQVVSRPIEDLRESLLKYKVALQPNKHPEIWFKLCQTIVGDYSGSLAQFFKLYKYDVQTVKNILIDQKKKFPYLAGPKISNYWLYVLSQYTNIPLQNLHSLSVAPDTHVIQASIHLGLVPQGSTSVEVAQAWQDILAGTAFRPIDIHTPLWLWSRQGFKPEI